jgi:hypothetical protein
MTIPTISKWLLCLLVCLSWNCVFTSAQQIADRATAADDAEIAVDGTVSEKQPPLLQPTSSLWDQSTRIQIVMHRNGEADPCGSVEFSLGGDSLLRRLALGNQRFLDKHHWDALLTDLVISELSKNNSNACGSAEENRNAKIETAKNETSNTNNSTFAWFCDMGPNRTVVQEDHDKLVRVPHTETLPCHFHTRQGRRITSLQTFLDEVTGVQSKESNTTTTDKEQQQPLQLHLYAVPAGRVFMFAASFVGETFTIHHVDNGVEHPIVLEVLSVQPRVFDIHNFFSMQEAKELVEKALNDTSEINGLHRSTTGALDGEVNSKRTVRSYAHFVKCRGLLLVLLQVASTYEEF